MVLLVKMESKVQLVLMESKVIPVILVILAPKGKRVILVLKALEDSRV
jgi:hypothetical protein